MNIFENKYLRKISIFIVLITLLLLIMSINSGSVFAKQYRVAIIPFKINAEKDMTFLKDGVFDMLSSRLSSEENAEVIDREETENVVESIEGILNEGKARKVGAKLKADYVLFGSLTIFGESVSIDSKMVDVTGDSKSIAFFNQSMGIGEVIPKINNFAEEINEIKTKKDDIKDVLKSEIDSAIRELEKLYKMAQEQEPSDKKKPVSKKVSAIPKPKVPKKPVAHKMERKITEPEEKPIPKPAETVKIKPRGLKEKISKAEGLKTSIKSIKDEISRLKKELQTE